MDTRKINLKFHAAPVVYRDIQNCELAVISISSSSRKLNNLLKSKLLNQMFLVSKFQKNISRLFKNRFDEKLASFLVINAHNCPDFKNKLVELAYQFWGTTIFIKCKNELCFDLENEQEIVRSVKEGKLFEHLKRWNNGNFEFEDRIFLHSN